MNKRSRFYWWRFKIDIPSFLEESIVWKLNSIGLNKFAIQFSPDYPDLYRLFIWLPSHEWPEEEREGLIECLMLLGKTFGITLRSPEWEKCHDEDWNAVWKKYWKPDPVGELILILPEWLRLSKSFSNRKVVKIDPGIAFGTGSHPTTRLCLEALERESLAGKSVADLGCGSGILSLTALALGASKLFAIDTDSHAVHSTMNNFLLNDFEQDSLKVLHGSIDNLQSHLNSEKVDLLLCNILLPVIKDLSPGFDQILKSDGIALLSGILLDQIPELTNFLNGLGWKVNNSWSKSNWGLIEISRT